MGLVILAAFIVVPLIEIALFIQIGGWIGLWPTLAIVVITAILGSWALRLQGLTTLARARQQLDRGVLPAHELFDGACLLFAGALLLTPGFFTDAVGALLFVQPVRDLLRQTLGRYVAAHAEVRMHGGAGPHGARGSQGPGGRGPTIDGDYVDLDAERQGESSSAENRQEVPPPEQPGRGWNKKD
ncbi:MAG: FxsA family protein [Rhodovibrionaceae bacterium]